MVTTNKDYSLKPLVEAVTTDSPIEITISIEHHPERHYPYSCAVYGVNPVDGLKSLYEYGETAGLDGVHMLLTEFFKPLKKIKR